MISFDEIVEATKHLDGDGYMYRYSVWELKFIARLSCSCKGNEMCLPCEAQMQLDRFNDGD